MRKWGLICWPCGVCPNLSWGPWLFITGPAKINARRSASAPWCMPPITWRSWPGVRKRKRPRPGVTKTIWPGLEKVAKGASYAVIVSDLRMPGMDGIHFLARARELVPDSVRIMLTGFADLQTAVDAVNPGHIFRFPTKPCEPQVLEIALEMGVSQYRLVMAEKELLEETLRGSI